MVKAVDIESLFQRYLDEDNLEKCDTLYLLYTIGVERAAKTLRVRYGRVGAINSVLEDLREEIGIEDISLYNTTEDTKENLRDVIRETFKQTCLSKILEFSKVKANNLSQTARELLYIILIYYQLYNELSIELKWLYRIYNILFQKQSKLDKAIDELISCYVIQSININTVEFPSYLNELINELREFIPEVEVKVSWREE